MTTASAGRPYALPESGRPPVAEISAGAVLAAVTLVNGGYFATTWGWVTIAALWGIAVALAVSLRMRPSGLAVALVAAATVYGVAVAASGAAQESLRTLLVVVAVAAFVAFAVQLRWTLPAVLSAIFLAAAYAAATRIFPDRIGVFDPVAGYRLSEPLGYWNALGILCAVGVIAAIALGARAGVGARAAAAATIPLLTLTLYFTFSRGSWIALAVALAAALALDPRRVQLATVTLAATPWAALAVGVASRSDALTRLDAAVADATADGRHVALWLLVACAGAGATVAALALAERSLPIPRAASLAWAGALALAVVLAVAAAFVRFGGPLTLGERAVDAFRAPPAAYEPDLNQRLFSFSGSFRVDVWEQAWNQFKEHPILGAGAGTYEQYWLQHREIPLKVRDAHSLYLETLAELGIVGLTLLLIVLLVPVYAAFKARRHPLVPAAFGAYVAYLVHAGVDWDWEMPAVTLTALFIGASIVVAARESEEEERPMGPRLRLSLLAGTLVLAAVAFVGLVGNMSLAQSADAAQAADWDEAESKARRAATWAPWSPEPWQAVGRAQLARGDVGPAAASFRKAIVKDDGDWNLWLDLARATEGRAQQAAIRRALALNPLSPEIAQLRKELGEVGVIEVAEEEKS